MRGILFWFVLCLLTAAPALAGETRESATIAVEPAPKKSSAEMRSERLDQLFARLHRATSDDDMKAAEQDIWSLWMAADSPTAEVLLQQATKAMNEGAPEQSLDILNRLIGAYPDYTEAWNKRATLYFLMGNYQASLADIDKVLDLEPRHFGALSGRGMIYQRQKNYTAALEAFRSVLAINPHMPSAQDAVKTLEKIEQGI